MKLYEINALVAEKVMGWEYEPETDTFIISRNEDGINCLDANPLGDHYFSPTTKIEHAWLIINKLEKDFSSVEIHIKKGMTNVIITEYFSNGYLKDQYQGYEKSTALSICRAALKAYGIDIVKEVEG